MKIRNKIIAVVVPLIVIPLIFIAILSTETAKIGITKIAKQLLSFKLEDFYKQVSSQYDILYSTGLIENKEFVDKAFTQISEYANKLKLSETGYIQVFKSDGTIFISPEFKNENISNTDFFKTMVKNKNGWIEYTFNGESRLGIFLYFAGWDWYLLVSENEKKFYADANKIQLQVIYIGSATMINPGICISDAITIGSHATIAKSLYEPGLYVNQSLRHIPLDYDEAYKKYAKVRSKKLIEKIVHKKC